MILKDENGNEYEYSITSQHGDLTRGICQPIKKEWPQELDDYWFATDHSTVEKYIWLDTTGDKRRKAFGNCFKTKKEAEYARDRIKSLSEAHIHLVDLDPGENVWVEFYVPKEYLKAWKYLEDKE